MRMMTTQNHRLVSRRSSSALIQPRNCPAARLTDASSSAARTTNKSSGSTVGECTEAISWLR
jgi:hypothetical protein